MANDRPVELRANTFATIGVGVALAKVAICANFSVDFWQTVEEDKAWSWQVVIPSAERRVLTIESCCWQSIHDTLMR